jgi:DNA polymerase III subunit beta
VMAEERNKPVKMLLRPGAVVLSAASHDLGEAEEALNVQYAGEEVAIGFNSRYVLEALAPIETDDIVFEFKDNLSPGVVKGLEEEGYSCVIMPMRI